MTIGKAFKLQIAHGVPLSEKDVAERKKTRYHNGAKVGVDDVVLHAYVYYDQNNSELTIIEAHHLDLYELDPNFGAPKNSYSIPYIQLKQEN